jgi:hypothetical protein
MKAFFSLFSIAVVVLMTVSCRKFVELGPPATQLVGTEVFNSDATATSAMSNIYKDCSLGNSFAGGGPNGVSVVGGLSADELDLYSTTDVLSQVYKNIILPNNSFTAPLWSGPYSVIYQSNAIIERLENAANISPGVRDQLKGEALFMRAFAHFYLAALYGDVPYVTGTDYRVNAAVYQQKYPDVLALIIQDLKNAKPLLADTYGFTKQERVRPNKWAAAALLARVYLYAQEWASAEAEASLVLEQKTLFNLTAVDGVFLKNSKEAIWQLKPVSTTLNTNDGNIFVLTAKPSTYALSADLVAAFEANDLRKSWVGTFSNTSGTWNFPYKYKIKTGASPLNEYSMVLRLAEQYLIRAEARMQQGKLADAVADLDVVRVRAGLPKIALSNPDIGRDALALAIEKERRMELFSEWGHRWFDLKRTGRIDAVLSAKKPGWTSTAALFPVPESELRLNGHLVQNGGYQK